MSDSAGRTLGMASQTFGFRKRRNVNAPEIIPLYKVRVAVQKFPGHSCRWASFQENF